MNDFELYLPTRVVFGRNAENRLGALLAEQGCRKVLVHYGSGSAVKSGLLDRIFETLNTAGIDCVSLGGVKPNPRLSKVYEGIELGRREQVDFILAVGGGSVIDSAKAIGYGLVHDFDVWELYAGKRKPSGCCPVGAVLTIAAAGSEMGNSSLITNEDGGLKRSCKSDYARCRFAVMNPELTYTLPPYHTACGGTDILMHTLERYFTGTPQLSLTDRFAIGLMKTVMEYTPIALREPDCYEARAELMWAGSLSHNGLTGCGGAGDWATHQLEHELGGMFDVIHGAGLAAVWGSWARYVVMENPARFALLATEVLDISADGRSVEALAQEGIRGMEAFFKSLGMPLNLRELGLEPTKAQLDELAYKCSFEGKRTIGQFKTLTQKDMRNIFELACN